MQKRRFIAGAICPICQTHDSIQVFTNEQHLVKECVDCGYTESLKNNVLSTRNTTTPAITENENTQRSGEDIIRIIDPYNGTK